MRDSKISRIELGRQNPTEEGIRVWCRACNVEEQVPELIAAHRQIDEMWEEYRQAMRARLTQQSQRVKSLYEQTKLIRAYEPQTVPGFLQRPGYTRAVIEDVARFHRLTDDLDQAVEGRLNRLRVLESGASLFSFVVEAGALYAHRAMNFDGAKRRGSQVDVQASDNHRTRRQKRANRVGKLLVCGLDLVFGPVISDDETFLEISKRTTKAFCGSTSRSAMELISVEQRTALIWVGRYAVLLTVLLTAGNRGSRTSLLGIPST